MSCLISLSGRCSALCRRRPGERPLLPRPLRPVRQRRAPSANIGPWQLPLAALASHAHACGSCISEPWTTLRCQQLMICFWSNQSCAG